MMILKLQKKYQEFLKKIIIKDRLKNKKILKKEVFISKPPVESYKLSEDQKRIRKRW